MRLKLYLLFVGRRNRKSGYAHVGYSKLIHYTVCRPALGQVAVTGGYYISCGAFDGILGGSLGTIIDAGTQ